MENISFKERVKNIAISEVKNYKKYFVDCEYLVCSDAFKKRDYYIIGAAEDNYQHLIGVHSLISPQEFYNKCFDGKLKEEDFDFKKRNQSEKSVKGSVREKIKVLPHAMKLFTKSIKVEETFVKNLVSCSFATTDGTCTLGFINSAKAHPKTLLKGNDLNSSKAEKVDLILRRNVGEDKFNKIIVGDSKLLTIYYEKIKDLIDESIIPSELKNSDSETTEVALGKDNTYLDKQS